MSFEKEPLNWEKALTLKNIKIDKHNNFFIAIVFCNWNLYLLELYIPNLTLIELALCMQSVLLSLTYAAILSVIASVVTATSAVGPLPCISRLCQKTWTVASYRIGAMFSLTIWMFVCLALDGILVRSREWVETDKWNGCDSQNWNRIDNLFHFSIPLSVSGTTFYW